MDQTLSKNISSKCVNLQNDFYTVREEIKQYFLKTYDLYSLIFSLVKSEETFYLKPQPLRQPLIFYYGHTTTFYINKLVDCGELTEHLNEKLEAQLAVGVDEMDWDDLNQKHYDWPPVSTVKQYRQKTKCLVLDILARIKPKKQNETIGWNSTLWIILMAIEHQRIHFETSAAIIRRLPVSQVQNINQFIECPLRQLNINKIPQNNLAIVPAVQFQWNRTIQKPYVYSWDQQFGEKSFKNLQFQSSAMLVSNGQFYQFMLDNGYNNTMLWSSQGQQWLNSTKTNKPIYWVKFDNIQPPYKLKTISNLIDMPWDWPVQVNNLEANAFCTWKGTKLNKQIRLPTQDEYYSIRKLIKNNQYFWQYQSMGNINLQYWMSPNPVNLFKENEFYGIVGNVWQHTCTPLYPFKSFKIHPAYEDYSTPTFDNRHVLMKGGSFMSSGCESIFHCRYAFRRHFYQFCGFRYVHSKNPIKSCQTSIDQSDQSVYLSLKQHYMNKQSYLHQLIPEIKKILQNKMKDKKCQLAILGCSVGRWVFDLVQKQHYIIGIDQTVRFFQMATKLLSQGSIKYKDLTIQSPLSSKQYHEKIKLYQMCLQNLDILKVNNIDVLIIDGNCLKKNTIGCIMQKSLKLFHTKKQQLIIMIIIEVQQYNQFNSMIAINKQFIQFQIQCSNNIKNINNQLVNLKAFYKINQIK